ncbi:MAG TPA: hypothetical protein DD412_07280 [Holosporales bacterium]|nr:hypothetical protein [Holosporales bacterium]
MSDTSQAPQLSPGTGSTETTDASQSPQKGSKKLILKIISLSLFSFIALAFVAYLSLDNYKNHATLLKAQLELSHQATAAGDVARTVKNLKKGLSLGSTKDLRETTLSMQDVQKKMSSFKNIDSPLLTEAFETFLEVKKQLKILDTFFMKQRALLNKGSQNTDNLAWVSQQIKEQTTRVVGDLSSFLTQITTFQKELQSQGELKKEALKSYESDTLNNLYLVLGLLGLAIFLLHTVAAYLISKPLAQITQRMRDINAGNMKGDVQGTEQNDEFGDIARMLHEFRENAIKIEKMQRHLQETIAESKKASQMKNQFMARIGHELRTPLNSIIGYSEMIVDSVNDKMDLQQLRQDINQIADAGQNLLNMVDSVLELTDEGENNIIAPERFNVREEIQQILPNLEVVILKNRNKFKVYCPDSTLLMDSDPKKTMKVLANLIENAANFTKSGQITLDITAGKLGDLNAICFKVKDTGCGIDVSKLKTLFNAFDHADSTTKSQNGSGLGLAIVKKICDDLHGQVSVESSLNQGATFYVTLPANHKEAHQRAEKINLSPLAEAI